MTPRDPRSLARRAVRRARRVLAGTTGASPDPALGWRDPDGPELVRVVPAAADPSRRAVSLVVLLPHLDLRRMTGGPNTALSIGARVAARGIPVRFVATHADGPLDEGGLRRHVAELAAPAASDVEAAPGGRDGATGESAAAAVAGGELTFETAGPREPLRLGPRDVLLATWWPTAYVARDALSVTGGREFLYLVQDFEPGFYAWSSQHALALATYGFPCRAIFNERLIREHFAASGVGDFAAASGPRSSIAFDPAVDRGLFRPRPRPDRPRLLFYARPRNPRNAFELGLRALRLAAQRGALDGWDCASIGDQVPSLPLRAGGEHALDPIPWQSLAGYAELLGRSDVLVSLMLSPHTSYPPLEMAAAGGLVVTNQFGVKSASALAAISPRIRAVAPEVEALADAIADAAGEALADRARDVGAGAAPMDARPAGAVSFPDSWGVALDPVIDWTVDAIHELAGTA